MSNGRPPARANPGAIRGRNPGTCTSGTCPRVGSPHPDFPIFGRGFASSPWSRRKNRKIGPKIGKSGPAGARGIIDRFRPFWYF